MVISIMIVDDDPMVRESVLALINIFPDNIKVIGEASNGLELLQKLKNLNPDVILMDIEMPIMDGIEATQKVKEQFPGTKILALTKFDGDAFILEMMSTGANGYLLKLGIDQKEMRTAIQMVMTNGFYFNDKVSFAFLKEITRMKNFQSSFLKPIELSDTEKKILKLICEEKTTDEIAEKLYYAPKTISKYREKLMGKIGVKSKVGLAIYAIKRGICI